MLWAGDDPTSHRTPAGGRYVCLTSPTDPVDFLVVDDDPLFCRTVSRALAALPLRPHAVGTGSDALRFLAAAPPFADAPRPAFLVLDFNLPDLNAPAVLASLRADPATRDLPVLVLTQIPGPADEHAAVQAGAQGYEGKPSKGAALRDLLLGFWRTHAHDDSDRR